MTERRILSAAECDAVIADLESRGGEAAETARVLRAWFDRVSNLQDEARAMTEAGCTIEELRAYVFREMELAVHPVREFERRRNPHYVGPPVH